MWETYVNRGIGWIAGLALFGAGALGHASETVLGDLSPAVEAATGDRAPLTLGVKFRSGKRGRISAIRFYRAVNNRRGFSVALFDTTSGERLAAASIRVSSSSLPGYVVAKFSSPVHIEGDKTYTAAYYTSNGNYSFTNGGLSKGITSGNLTFLPGGGVFNYGSGMQFPTHVYMNSNYFVDVVFDADMEAEPAPEPVPAPAPVPSPVPEPAPAPAPSSWTVGQVPFLPTSSWNTPIPAGKTYTKLNWPAPTGYNYWINWDGYTPAIIVPNSSDPIVQVSMPANWGWPAGTVSLRIPAGVTGANGTDAELVVIDGTKIHNFWNFKRTGSNTATTSAYGVADALTSNGWGTKSPFLSAGIVAAGSSQYAGMLIQAEVDAGEIEHALQIALLFELQKPGYTGEAIAGDGGSATGISVEGERLAIPPSVTMPSGLSPLGQKVFRALQKYGAFNIDVSGTTTFRAQSNAFDGATIDALRRDVQKIMPLLHRVN